MSFTKEITVNEALQRLTRMLQDEFHFWKNWVHTFVVSDYDRINAILDSCERKIKWFENEVEVANEKHGNSPYLKATFRAKCEYAAGQIKREFQTI